MTDRMDRIEAILERIAEQQEQTQQQVSSNARSIEATSNAIAELRQAQEVDRADFRSSIEDVVGMVGTLATEMHTMQSNILGLQTENRRILERLETHFSDGHGAA